MEKIPHDNHLKVSSNSLNMNYIFYIWVPCEMWAGIAQVVQRLATGWNDTGIESR